MLIARRLGGLLLAIGPILWSVSAPAANDQDECSKREGVASVAACARLIESKQASGIDLAVIYALRAASYRTTADYDAAIADFTRAIELLENVAGADVIASAYVARASSYSLKGDLEASVADYRKALELDPKNGQAADGLGRTETALRGQKQLAIAAQPTAPVSPCGDASRSVAFLMTRPAQPLSVEEECALKAKDSFKECDACPELAVVPSGSFIMGSPQGEPKREPDEGPQTKITIPGSFAVGKFEVSRREYEAFVAAAGHKVERGCRIWNARLNGWDLRTALTFRNPWFSQDDTHPVVCVSWSDAIAFVNWLRDTTGKPYRLLSEAEWEYAARAGTSTPFFWGSSISTDQANFDGRAVYGNGRKGPWRQRTVPVDGFQPNSWGLYNMHGNVWEWVEDCYGPDGNNGYKAIPKITTETGGPWERFCEDDEHAFRGGSWLDDPDYLRSARRVWHRPGGRYNYLGFRVARTLMR